jgi:predicted ester cyclase
MKQAPIRLLLGSAMLLSTVTIYSQEKNNHHMNSTKQTGAVMPVSNNNEALVRRLYEQCLNKRQLDLLPDIISADFPGAAGEKGAAAFIKPITALINAFPDIQWEVEQLFGEGDKVAASWKWQGLQTAVFNGFAATGKIISNEGMAIYECRNGKIVNVRVQTDRLGFLQALGVVPANPAALAAKTSPDKVSFIDKFVIPAAAVKEFSERMRINRAFVRHLPGFIDDAAYSYTDSEGNYICVTVAQWASKAAVNNAKEAVQAEYKRQGFDMPAMLKRLNITMDRGLYTQLPE